MKFPPIIFDLSNINTAKKLKQSIFHQLFVNNTIKLKERGFLFTGDMSFLEEIPDIDDDEEEELKEEE